MSGTTRPKEFPALLEAFFMDRLINQRKASPHTVAAYRDTFRLLLVYAQAQLKKQPSQLRLDDLGAPVIGGFLNYLEKQRGNGVVSRNLRLAAIHSFFRYVSFERPDSSALIERILAIPSKRRGRALVGYLKGDEIDALLKAPDRHCRGGRRDHALMLLAIQTGLRLSELINLRCQDLTLNDGAQVRCEGKGRKERCLPLDKSTAAIMRAWLRERDGQPGAPAFPNARGGQLSPDGVAYLLSKHVSIARKHCPSLKKKRVTPHVLRHTTAMNLLQSGVDCSVIALWLGHESVETTLIYLDADTEMKERILQNIASPKAKPSRYHPDDRTLAFLKRL